MKKSKAWQNHFFNFLAVILGVYLAFLINQKAENRRQKEEVRTTLQLITNELDSDIHTFETYQIPKNEKFQQDLLKLLPIIHKDSLEKLNEKLSIVLEVDNYVPSIATYSSLKSSGKFDRIQNVELVKNLSIYYDFYAAETTAKSEYQVDFFKEYLLSWCMQNIDLENFSINSTNNLELLKNYILIYHSVIQQKTESFHQLVSEARYLKNQIDKELK